MSQQIRMIGHLVLPLLLLGGCASLGSLSSETMIEPGKAFRLGGGQREAFSVTGRNSGRAPISVFVEQNGKRDSIVTIGAGGAIDAAFPKGAMAILRNESDEREARVAVRVKGDIGSLGMGYEANRK
jgi:hypothetical protein